MFEGHTIGVVIPCFNEETQIGTVLRNIPEYIESIIVVDDFSSDRTLDVTEELAERDNRISLISHSRNLGVGAAISSGYKKALEENLDIVVVIAGDNQMNVRELPGILSKLILGKFDYIKTNRLFSKESRDKIPKIRFVGNYILSILTKFASGYWNITDSQSGYAAISKKALSLIDWNSMYPRYGQPNDILILLNIESLRVSDFPAMPVYGVGEKSKMKISRVIIAIPTLLAKRFLFRIWEKYVVRQMHPISLFYFSSFFFLAVGIIFFIRMLFVKFVAGSFPLLATISCFFSFSIFLILFLFALWLDYEHNLPLQIDYHSREES